MFGTAIYTFHAKDALCSVFPVSGVVCDINFHGTDAFAFSAGDTLFLITFDPYEREVTHWLQKHGYRADVFAECTVILKGKGQNDSHGIIKDISDDEGPEHDALDVPYFSKKQ